MMNMKLQEGPAFGALVIGFGFAYFMYEAQKNIFFSVLLGLVVSVADYFFLVWVHGFKKGKK